MKKKCLVLLGLFSLCWACQKETTDVNPFLTNQQNQDTVSIVITQPDPTSFAGIYQTVFRPTCSNIGCHDGTFEPDFRTMESAYHTLLYQSPIKNNGNYTYRVQPGNANASVLVARLENQLTPPMPIQIEPDSDWGTKRLEYIQNIKTWINNGARDVAGNTPTPGVYQPELAGAAIQINGNWATKRRETSIIPMGTQGIDLYLSFRTDTLNASRLEHNVISFSTEINDFSNALKMDLEILPSPIHYIGVNYDTLSFTHHLHLNPITELGDTPDQWFFRAYVQIPGENVTEIPNNDGIFYIKNYMSFVWER